MWMITKDHVHREGDELQSRVGYHEEHSRISFVALTMGAQSEPLPDWESSRGLVKFRLYDDDNECYYEGWLHDDNSCENQENALKWAEGDSGCTIIRVKRNGKWILEIG